MKVAPSVVKKLFFDAVEEAYRYIVENYNRVAPRFKVPERKRGEHPFICWSESDLRTLIVYYLMQKIKDIGFIHTEIVLKRIGKFKYDGKFQEKLWKEAVDEALRLKNRKFVAGDIDLAITPIESDSIPFILIAEIKYYHYDVKRYGRDPAKEIEEAYNLLKAFKEIGFTKEIAIVIGDHYYHRTQPSKSKKLEEYAKKHQHDIIYLKV